MGGTSYGRMMRQAFSLRAPLPAKPRVAAAEAALPWAGMNEPKEEDRNHGLHGFNGLRVSYGFHGINLLSE